MTEVLYTSVIVAFCVKNKAAFKRNAVRALVVFMSCCLVVFMSCLVVFLSICMHWTHVVVQSPNPNPNPNCNPNPHNKPFTLANNIFKILLSNLYIKGKIGQQYLEDIVGQLGLSLILKPNPNPKGTAIAM